MLSNHWTDRAVIYFLYLCYREKQHESFGRFTKSFEVNMAQIQQVIHEYSKKHLGRKSLYSKSFTLSFG